MMDLWLGGGPQPQLPAAVALEPLPDYPAEPMTPLRAARPIIVLAVVALVGVALEYDQPWILDVLVDVAALVALAYGVRWLWHRGLPALRAWWNAGRG